MRPAFPAILRPQYPSRVPLGTTLRPRAPQPLAQRSECGRPRSAPLVDHGTASNIPVSSGDLVIVGTGGVLAAATAMPSQRSALCGRG